MLGPLGPGTSVMQVMASDADDPTYGSSARLVYSVLDGENHFTVDPKTGEGRGHKGGGVAEAGLQGGAGGGGLWIEDSNQRSALSLPRGAEGRTAHGSILLAPGDPRVEPDGRGEYKRMWWCPLQDWQKNKGRRRPLRVL